MEPEFTVPLNFPDLPANPLGTPWPHNVLEADRIIREAYRHVKQVLGQADQDPLRLRVLSESIMQQTLPLLEALDLEVGDENWAVSAANALAAQLVGLERASAETTG